jgi:hypothetical protein
MIYYESHKHPYEKDAMNVTGENMEDDRKKWLQPQLIVLGRGTPEENVLTGCKIKNGSMSGRNATKTKCFKGALCGNNTCSSVTATSS